MEAVITKAYPEYESDIVNELATIVPPSAEEPKVGAVALADEARPSTKPRRSAISFTSGA